MTSDQPPQPQEHQPQESQVQEPQPQGQPSVESQPQESQPQEPQPQESREVVGAGGYREFRLGEFRFWRDDYFVYVRWPTGSHVASADAFLKALQRDVAWEFFYGIVNFDGVLGTVNHYGTVDLFAGRYNDAWRKAELDHLENFPTPQIRSTFAQMLDDWTNQGFDPFAAPDETGSAFGPKHGHNTKAVTRHRVTATRMVGLPGDEPLRADSNGYPVNRQFTDVGQTEPLIQPAPGFQDRVHAFNLFKYLSRSDVTWNPSVVSVCRDSLYCPTTEEYILPIIHGNDRVEWFVQLSDTIYWDVEDRDSGAVRSKVTMHPGDVAAMPADIRHQGYAPKRAMLLVWENADPALPHLISTGQLPTNPIDL
jgi:Hydroquinone 1,2-dioxygenase large subunit N-terminal